ncbi:MAG: asparagine synthase (glutamine-hydrolyzing) [Myxococcales bacterium]|nr:asparagine synthase (glutamine-hydrolyzing) [Myxococcales bacterium]
MCGIVGAFALAEPLDPAALERPLAALRHRGPDGEGRFVSSDRRVALGHRRLAIIDRAGGAQPIASEDGQVIAVVNGEFYGHAAIRRGLVDAGHRFRTASDSEILIHLYEERGIDAIEALRGEFAFILWDARERLAIAARDRFGVRPLVYATFGGALWLASEAKALLAAGAPAAWDEASVWAATQMHYAPPDRTLFRGIRQVEPGDMAIIRGGELQLRRYWDLDYPPAAAIQPIAEEEAVAAVREAIDEAVRIRLEAEVPIAFQLSGGIDSSAVVALAAPHLPRPPLCYSVAFDRPGYDERDLARVTAEHVGAELRLVEVSPRAIAEHLADAVTQGEGVAINGHIAAKRILARAMRADGVGVVLTGEGSDEIFAGYAHLRGDLLSQGTSSSSSAPGIAALAASNQASAGLMLASGEGIDLSSVRAALGFVPGWMAAKATLGRRVGSLVSGELVAAGQGRDVYAEFLDGFDLEGQLLDRARVHQSLYLWSKSALATYILRTLGDGIEMGSSLEGRLPLLDHRLFELVRGLPIDLLIRGGVEKYVLRRAIGGRIPAAIREREKHPFLAPPLVLAESAPIQEVLRDLTLPPFIDRARLRAALDRLPTLPEGERRAWDPALMLVASLCVLHRSYGL